MSPDKNGPPWEDDQPGDLEPQYKSFGDEREPGKIIIDDFGSSFLKFLARCAVLVLSCSGLAMLLWVASPKPPGVWTVVLISIALVAFLRFGAPWLLKKADLE